MRASGRGEGLEGTGGGAHKPAGSIVTLHAVFECRLQTLGRPGLQPRRGTILQSSTRLRKLGRSSAAWRP